MPFRGCHEKRRCSIICRALVNAGTGLHQSSDNFKVPFPSCNVKEVSFHHLSVPWSLLAPDSTRTRTTSRCPSCSCYEKRSCSIVCPCLGLCWHRTQPEIGQLQGAPHELKCKEVSFHHLVLPWSLLAPDSTRNRTTSRCPFCSCNVKRCHSIICACLGLCWHRTQPEIGQLRGAHSAAATKRGFFSIICRALGLCWHRSPPEIGQLPGAQTQSCYVKRCHAPLICRGTCSFLAPDSTRNRTTSRCPLLSCNDREVLCSIICPCLGLCWHRTQPEIRTTSRCPS